MKGICANCNKDFVKVRTDQKFCSDECRHFNKNKLNRIKSSELKFPKATFMKYGNKIENKYYQRKTNRIYKDRVFTAPKNKKVNTKITNIQFRINSDVTDGLIQLICQFVQGANKNGLIVLSLNISKI